MLADYCLNLTVWLSSMFNNTHFPRLLWVYLHRILIFQSYVTAQTFVNLSAKPFNKTWVWQKKLISVWKIFQTSKHILEFHCWVLIWVVFQNSNRGPTSVTWLWTDNTDLKVLQQRWLRAWLLSNNSLHQSSFVMKEKCWREVMLTIKERSR